MQVRWDDIEANRHSRVSPWEIEPSGSVSSSSNFMAPGCKRSRSGLPSSKEEFPVPGSFCNLKEMYHHIQFSFHSPYNVTEWSLCFVTDGIGASDFGESSRFQKVLQGQEIFGYSTLYDGVDGQNQHPSEVRSRFPSSHGSGIATIGNGVRDPIVNSDISCKGIDFGESFRFHKVLQGQEIFPSSPYRRVSNTNKALENGCLGISEGVQMPSSRNGWSAVMQGYKTHMRPSAQVSSPSSVLMFQQASNPVPIYNFNDQEEQAVNTQTLFHDPKTCREKFTVSSYSKHTLRGDDQWRMHSIGLSREHIHHGISQPFIASQDLVSSCKSSCRLFGFSLTEDSHVTNKKDNTTSITSPLNPVSSFLPRVGEQFHPKPPAITNAVGSNCTKVSHHIHGLRETLFDISL